MDKEIIPKGSILDIFYEFKTIWNIEVDSINSDYLPRISNSLHCTFKNKFHIDSDDIILYVNDTSYSKNRSQGVVITTSGIFCIPDESLKLYSFYWKDIAEVKYDHNKNNLDIFYVNSSRSSYISIFYFINHYDDRTKFLFGTLLSIYFTKIAKCYKTHNVQPIDEFDRLLKEGNINDAITIAYKNKDHNGMETLYKLLAELYFSQEEFNNVLSICNEGIQKKKENLYFELNSLKYQALKYLNNESAAREIALDISTNCLNNPQIKNKATSDFEIYDLDYINNFTELPYSERKVLMLVNEYKNLSYNHLSIIRIDKIKNSEINFPLGHPIVNQLYIAHPYCKYKYLIIDNYELELLEDKIREFCFFVQCLGATRIEISSINNATNNCNNTQSNNFKGGVNSSILDVSASYNNNDKIGVLNEISKSINLKQEYLPTSSPYLPNNLIWYYNEPSWQRLYEQRMLGSLLNHEERMETRKNRVIESSELKIVKGELDSLFMDMNIGINHSLDESLSIKENDILSIQVEFAPLDSLKKEVNKEHELEYIEELRSCLIDGGKISQSERRLLDKFRVNLGLTQERASELELSVINPLTPEESEYLDEYKFCYQENSTISLSERRLLDKLRIRLQISEERAKQIESMI